MARWRLLRPKIRKKPLATAARVELEQLRPKQKRICAIRIVSTGARNYFRATLRRIREDDRALKPFSGRGYDWTWQVLRDVAERLEEKRRFTARFPERRATSRERRMTNFPFLVRHTDADSEGSFTTKGWTSKVYRIGNEPLRFSKTTLHLSNDIFLTQVALKEGRFRNVAEIDPGRMTIGFYTRAGNFAVSGARAENAAASLAYDKSRWDVMTDAPAFSQSIHLSPEVVEKIISQEARHSLQERLRGADGPQAIAFPITPAGEQLRTSIKGAIHLAEQAEMNMTDAAPFEWVKDDLLQAAACFIDELTEVDSLPGPEGRKKRHLIALEIEKLLWADPITNPATPKSIDEFAARFDCSRRRIQQIVEEHFGVGFVALKRFIRLQQAHAAIAASDGSRPVTSIALEYEFEHQGRFSRYFKEMFGKKPSWIRNAPSDPNSE